MRKSVHRTSHVRGSGMCRPWSSGRCGEPVFYSTALHIKRALHVDVTTRSSELPVSSLDTGAGIDAG